MKNNFDWSVYDGKVDIADLRNLANKTTKPEFKKVAYGEYCVEITNLILTKSNSGSDMLKGRFKIVNGDLEGEYINMYQSVKYRFQIDICNAFLRSLNSTVDIYFDGYDQYGDLIKSIWMDVKDSYVYRLHYDCTPNGYDSFKILGAFDSSF